MKPRTTRPRVLLAGAFGQGNPGDEALLAAFTRALPDHDPDVVSAAPSRTTAEHGVTAVARHDTTAVARAIAGSDAVVVAGGTIFKTLHHACGRPRHALLARTAALAAVTRALRKPFALLGVGAAALEGGIARGLARAIVRAADLLVLRDEESATHLAAAGAPAPFRVGADAAWTLLAPPQRQTAPTVALRDASGRLATVGIDGAPAGAGDYAPLVVALSHLAGGDDLGERLAGALQPALTEGVPVHLQPWQLDRGEGGDEALATEVSRRLGREPFVVPPPHDLADARETFARARAVLALRFHAVPAAAAAGVPVLAYAHEPKLEGAARRLEQPSVPADAPPAAVAEALRGTLDGEPAPIERVERERSRAEEGFRLLRVLLARGRSEEAVDVDGLLLRPEEWLG